MKQHYKILTVTVLLLAAVWPAGVVRAQALKKASQAGVKAAFNYAPYSVSGATAASVKAGMRTVKVDWSGIPEFHQKFFNAKWSAPLERGHYGALADWNARAVEIERLRAWTQYREVDALKTKLAGYMQGRVYQEMVPYHHFLPKDARLILVGELHGLPELVEEFGSLVLLYHWAYPQRRVYVLTEFLEDAAPEAAFSPDQFITRSEQLYTRNAALHAYQSEFKVLLANNVKLLGMEDYPSLQKAVGFPARRVAFSEYAASLAGMRARNRHWKKRIQEVRAYDPEGIIFVYAGMGHTGYHQPFSLANELRELNPFNIQLNTPEGQFEGNTLFAFFIESEDVRHLFNAAREHKLVESWAPDTPERYKKLLGYDLTVYVHPPHWRRSR